MSGCPYHVSPTGDLAYNPSICPDWELNRQPFGSQAHTQSTELRQPGLQGLLLIIFCCFDNTLDISNCCVSGENRIRNGKGCFQDHRADRCQLEEPKFN